ncbi:MAG: sodium-dependent transporter, partial [Saprospiraceae bacterium]|nr:sodium-dependent transporter [Saprospiraceae bacterium]
MANKQWSSRLAFILTTAAFSVGVGNIWRFPYMVGEGGGGAFLFVYIILCLIIGVPILIMEMTLGRMAGTTPLLGFGKLSSRKSWNYFGWFGVIGNILIMSYYVVVLAWVLIYAYEALVGRFNGMSADVLGDHFSTIAASSVKIISVVLLILAMTWWILKQGLQQGLEKYTKGMMIALLLIMIGLSLWAGTLDQAMEAYRWYLKPDFSKISIDTVLSAMSQLFFSVGVGMTIAFIFGSYASKKDNMVTGAAWIIFADTFIAILAGFMLFPIIFSYGMAPDAGPNLIFVTMATVFGLMGTLGQLLGTAFFILLFLAGFTSFLTALHGIKASFEDRFLIRGSKS